MTIRRLTTEERAAESLRREEERVRYEKEHPRPAGPGTDDVLALMHRGFHVFPVEPYEKIPFQVYGRGLTWSESATDNPGDLRELGWPDDANIGVACKLSGLLVIDIEGEHSDGYNPAARPWLTALLGGVPSTYITGTPSLGEHWYFRNPGTYGNGTGLLPDGIDVRGGSGLGGYVLGAGSYVIEQKKGYEGRYEAINKSRVRPLPAEIERLLIATERPKGPVVVETSSRRALGRAEGILAWVLSAEPGRRADYVFKSGIYFAPLIGVLGQDAAEAWLLDAAGEIGAVGKYGERECLRFIRNGFRLGLSGLDGEAA